MKAGVWFRRARLLIVAPDSQAPACPLSGRNSTYRPVQIRGTGSGRSASPAAAADGLANWTCLGPSAGDRSKLAYRRILASGARAATYLRSASKARQIASALSAQWPSLWAERRSSAARGLVPSIVTTQFGPIVEVSGHVTRRPIAGEHCPYHAPLTSPQPALSAEEAGCLYIVSANQSHNYQE